MKVFNFVTRIVTGIDKFDHVSRARDGLGRHTTRQAQMCDQQEAIVAHSMMVRGEPEALAAHFTTLRRVQGV